MPGPHPAGRSVRDPLVPLAKKAPRSAEDAGRDLLARWLPRLRTAD